MPPPVTTQPLLCPRDFLRLPPSHPPVLLVVIDTEEEFEWGQGFFREKTSVRAMQGIPRFQRLFDEYRVRPTYVVDYPIATKSDGYAALKEFQDSGRAVIGAHLHPWVNPPFEETPSDVLSYPGNLPAALERSKLLALTDAIEGTFGRRPTIYKAGRYGIGANTAATLEALGYEIDLSVCPGLDSRADGGPDFTSFRPEPYRFGAGLLEVPSTAAFVGTLHRLGPSLRRLSGSAVGKALRMRTVLSKLGALDRLRVSPEEYELEQQVRVTRALLRRGVRVINLAFHSPSATPGYTDFVRNDADLEAFLGRLRGYFEFFLGELNGVALTPHELRDRLVA